MLEDFKNHVLLLIFLIVKKDYDFIVQLMDHGVKNFKQKVIVSKLDEIRQDYEISGSNVNLEFTKKIKDLIMISLINNL
jgi:hypothetical protein